MAAVAGQTPVQLVAGSFVDGILTPGTTASPLVLKLPTAAQIQTQLDASSNDPVASQLSASIFGTIINPTGAAGVYAIDPTSDGYLTITMTPKTQGLACTLQVTDSKGVALPAGTDNSVDAVLPKTVAQVHVPVKKNNRILVRAASFNGLKGDYILSIEGRTDKEPETLNSAATIYPTMATPRLYSGSIESATDADVFRVVPTETAKLIVQLAPANNSKLNCRLAVRSKGQNMGSLAEDGNLVNNYSQNGDPGDRYLALDVEAGKEYFIIVRSFQKTTGAYKLSCGYTARTDGIGDSKDLALPINYNFSVGEMDTQLDGITRKPIAASRYNRPELTPTLNNSADSDWYYFWGNGETINISTYYDELGLVNGIAVPNARTAPSFRVVDESGKTLVDGNWAQSSVNTVSSSITSSQFTLPKGLQRYYIRVYSTDSIGASSRQYVLDLDLASRKDSFKRWVIKTNTLVPSAP